MFRLTRDRVLHGLTELTPALVPSCARILREEWPKITLERLYQVVDNGDDGSGFPCSLVMIQDQQHSTEVLAHCRITKVLNYANSTYIESIVVDKSHRGHGLGRQIINLAEEYVKSRGITHMFLSCLMENAAIFIHHGYRYCEPKVATLGSAMLGSSGPPPYAVALPGWEHIYDGFQSVSDLIKEENREGKGGSLEENTSSLEDNSERLKLKTRTIKYYDSMTPELSDYGYAWLAKEL
ncbi:N-alpha-acetyltransferase 80-like [Amphiura filiformis]|uniref:N-alpha-acetyltransferase 80-like n=1 Tax=Amphiura filiformis TaxID=82378 RepID=UPI003B210F74